MTTEPVRRPPPALPPAEPPAAVQIEPSNATRVDPLAAIEPPWGAAGQGLDQQFDRESLVALRSAVAAHGQGMGFGKDQLADLLLVAHELASNAILHGGGHGRLRLWQADGDAYCRVSDAGGGFAGAAEAGYRVPKPGAPNGRGLWLVRQLADRVAITTDVDGTVVTAGLRIDDAHGKPDD